MNIMALSKKTAIGVEDIPQLFIRFTLSQTPQYIKFLKEQMYDTLSVNTPFRKNISVLPCDQTASGFPLKCIDTFLQRYVYPCYSNTHSNNLLGRMMSKYISESKDTILKHVGACTGKDAIIFSGSGCSGAINHLVWMIKPKLEKCTVFITNTEHYSNLLPWYHHAKKVIVLNVSEDTGLLDIDDYTHELQKAKGNFILSVSACSNVTGVIQDTNYLAAVCHYYSGLFFADFAASAPYVPIDMHTDDKSGQYYDAIFISPHKFPGGPSSPGILIFNKSIACNSVTYTPSGGTVSKITTAGPKYSTDIEVKESGGTPNIIGIIRAGLTFSLQKRYQREITMYETEWTKQFQGMLLSIQSRNTNRLSILNPISNLHRLPIFSFQIFDRRGVNVHYNLVVVLLCDLFGIMSRGGVSCSGIYSDMLLGTGSGKAGGKVREADSKRGWVRVTLHAIHSHDDLLYIANAIEYIIQNLDQYSGMYTYSEKCNTFEYKGVGSKVLL